MGLSDTPKLIDQFYSGNYTAIKQLWLKQYIGIEKFRFRQVIYKRNL